MSLAKQIQKLSHKEERPDLAWAQARIPAQLKAQVEAKFLSLKSQGKKMNWQLLIRAACKEFLE